MWKQIAIGFLAATTIFGQSDVTQPGDLIVGSSANTPISGAVSNAIDDEDTVYLNLDKLNTGFTVTPQVGSTIVTSITLKSAGNAPERDPAAYILSGSNNGTAFTEIIRGNVPPFPARNTVQTFSFANTQAYKAYRLIFPTVANPAIANSMQIAEVEFVGAVEPQDVTTPGDTVAGTSNNTPVSGGAGNSIDDLPSEYRNFDKLNAGFTVTPSIGESIVVGLTIKSGADAPERDPASYSLSGSHDGVTFVPIAAGDVPPFSGRSLTQRILFDNSLGYLTYRVIFPTIFDATAADSLQVAEVELLGFAANSGAIPRFRTNPSDTQLLLGASGRLQVSVNGPWKIQWYLNGFAIAGATEPSYDTPPATAASDGDSYHVIARNGALATRSATARIHIFTPSLTKTIAINFGGAAPNEGPFNLGATDVAGVWPQAYWNNAVGDSGALSGDTLLDSDGVPSAAFVDWQTPGSWGAGIISDIPDGRMLNGYMDPRNGNVATVTFSNLQPGKYTVIAYLMNRAGAFDDADYSVAGVTTSVVRIRAQNADEYNASATFLRGLNSDTTVRRVGNYIEFPSVSPPTDGAIVFTAQSTAGSPTASAPVSGIQLIPVLPATLTITQSDSALTLQWDQLGFILHSSATVNGIYSPVSDASGNRYSVAASSADRFYTLIHP
jgi:hypothetical protein